MRNFCVEPLSLFFNLILKSVDFDNFQHAQESSSCCCSRIKINDGQLIDEEILFDETRNNISFCFLFKMHLGPFVPSPHLGQRLK